MTKEQKAKISHFISRPFMYIPELEKKQIVAFVTGFEIGDGNLGLTEAISQLLETKAGIEKKALGWSYQIQEYADREAIDWWAGFKTVVEKIMEDKHDIFK